MKEQALISIIIPTFNRANLLLETLKCVQGQTYKHWECIVVDDGSTDSTADVIQEWMAGDARFKYHIRPKTITKGANGCRNYGFSLSTGAFVNWLDSDDLFSEDKLEAQVLEIQKSQRTNGLVVTCKWNRFATHVDGILPKETHINKPFNSGLDLLKHFNKFASFFPSHAYLVSRELVKIVGPWNESLLVNQDGEFFTRVLLNASSVMHADKGMVYYRTHDSDTVSGFQTEEKMHSAITSWQLIGTHIAAVADLTDFPYFEHAKNYLFEKINNRAIQKQYSNFFKEQLKRVGLAYQLRTKLKRIFKN